MEVLLCEGRIRLHTQITSLRSQRWKSFVVLSGIRLDIRDASARSAQPLPSGLFVYSVLEQLCCVSWVRLDMRDAYPRITASAARTASTARIAGTASAASTASKASATSTGSGPFELRCCEPFVVCFQKGRLFAQCWKWFNAWPFLGRTRREAASRMSREALV